MRLSFAFRISNLGHSGRHSTETPALSQTGLCAALWVFHPKPRHTQIESTRGAIVNALVLCVTIDPVRSAINKAAHPPHRWRRERVDLHLREVENPPSARQLHPNVLRQMRALVQQRTYRIRRRSRLGADRPRVCGLDAIGDFVVRKSVPAAISTTVVHSNVGDLNRGAEV